MISNLAITDGTLWLTDTCKNLHLIIAIVYCLCALLPNL